MRLFGTIVWKEWLGLRWKLAALCAILLAPVILCLVELDARMVTESLVIIAMAYNAVAPIYLAMHVVAEDNSAGTLEFIRGLPIPLARLAMIRILATIAVLVAPLVLAAALMYLAALILPPWVPEFRYIGVGLGQAVGPTLAALFVAASLFAWTTALSMSRPSELRVGIIGLVTAVAWGAWTVFTVAQWDRGSGEWNWLYGITALGPFGAAVLFDPGLTASMRVAMAIGQLASLCGLVIFASRRFGILERPGSRTRGLPSANAALWWMQWREAWPIGIAGLGTMLVLSIVSTGFSAGARDSVNLFRSMLYHFSALLGVVWAIVIATGLFSADLEPGLVAFWRSRPIDPGGWFRVKYLTGALVIAAFIELPALPAAAVGQPLEGSLGGSLVAFLACVPVTHLAIYSIAVLIACLVRQIIYAGILSLGAVLFLIGLPPLLYKGQTLPPLNFIQLMGALSRGIDAAGVEGWLTHWAIYVFCTLALTVAATWLALRVIQKDLALHA